MPICKHCKKEKPLTDFSVIEKLAKPSETCRKCRRERNIGNELNKIKNRWDALAPQAYSKERRKSHKPPGM
jgi:hypothetical protein